MQQAIPPQFYSFDSGEPFKRCVECDRPLDDDCEYMIEKAMKTYDGYSATDVIFDYAICMNCAMVIRQSFSEKSLEAIEKYFSNVVPRPTTILLDNSGYFNIDECLGQCLITGKPQKELKEFQIYAYCKGNSLQRQVPPYMVSNEAVEDLLPLLSASTNDILDDFFKRHFSPDPSIFNPIPRLILG